MKSSIFIVLLLFLSTHAFGQVSVTAAGASHAQGKQTLTTSEDDQIREILLSEILPVWSWHDELKTVCVAVDSDKDPSHPLLERLRKLDGRIKKNSACSTKSGAIDVSSGSQAVILSVSKLNKLSAGKVVAAAGSYLGNMAADGCEYALTKQEGAWKIVSKDKCWLS